MQYRAMAAAIPLACLPAISLPAAAQDVQRIEVTGAYTAQRRDDTAGASLVSREELLRHGDRTLADALRRVPGITVADTGKGSEIRMRGLGQGYTTVLLNGAPLPPGFTIDALAPAMIERVEIIRTASAELAAQGIAGTVNVILRRQAARIRNDARIGADWLHGVLAPSGSWQWAGAQDSYDWSLNGAISSTLQREDDWAQETATDSAGAPRLARQTAALADIRNRAASLSPRVAWKRPGGSVAWQGYVNQTRRTNAFRAEERTVLGQPTDYPANGSWLDIRGTLLRSELTWQQELADGLKGQARFALQHYPRRSDFQFFATRDGARLPDVRQVRSDIRESTLSGSAKVEAALADGHRLTAGWDMEAVLRTQNRAEQDFAAASFTDDRYRGHIGRAALFVQDEWTVSPAWSLSAGLRWEALRTSVAPQGGAAVAQASSMASPLLQSLYKASPGQRWRAALSRSYKTPAMPQLVPRRYTIDNGNSQTDPDTQGNPRLRPELAWGLDAALEQDLGADGMLSASLYRRRIDDVNVPLLFDDHGRWVRMPANQGRAELWGGALELKAALSPHWTVRAHAARDWSRVAAVPGPDNRLARQTPRSAGAGADYRYADGLTFSADLAWQAGGWARESAFYAYQAPPGRTLDLAASWRMTPDTRLKVSGANLLPRDAWGGAAYRDSTGARLLSERRRGEPTLRLSLEQRW